MRDPLNVWWLAAAAAQAAQAATADGTWPMGLGQRLLHLQSAMGRDVAEVLPRICCCTLPMGCCAVPTAVHMHAVPKSTNSSVGPSCRCR